MTDIQLPHHPAPIEVTRPLSQRLAPLKWSLIVYAIGEAAITLSSLIEIGYYQTVGADPYLSEAPAMMAFFLFATFAGIVQLLGLFASFIFTCMWTFRAMKNLHIIGEPTAKMSPGWAVGWYFIPFANLFKPLQGMDQIWRGSHIRAGMPSNPSGQLGKWWGFWLVSNFAANISVRMTGILEPGPNYLMGLGIGIVSALAGVGAAYFLIKIARKVTDAQTAMQRGGLADTFD